MYAHHGWAGEKFFKSSEDCTLVLSKGMPCNLRVYSEGRIQGGREGMTPQTAMFPIANNSVKKLHIKKTPMAPQSPFLDYGPPKSSSGSAPVYSASICHAGQLSLADDSLFKKKAHSRFDSTRVLHQTNECKWLRMIRSHHERIYITSGVGNLFG